MGALRLVTSLSLAVGLTACASSGTYTPHPFPTPGAKTGSSGGGTPKTTPPDPTPPVAPPVAPVAPPANPRRPVIPPTTATADGYALSSTALSLRGAPYQNGGTTPSGFDCSGFVQYVFGQNGVKVPRDVKEQFKLGKSVDPNRLEPGDLLFFSTTAPGPTHVGIAIGGNQFVHAPSEKGVVRVEQLSVQYWASRFVGARRVG